MAINLDSLIIHIIVNTVLVSPVLWLSGRALVGRQKAKFTDALMIVFLGTVVGAFWSLLRRIPGGYNPADTLAFPR